jgi:hypothetical protein
MQRLYATKAQLLARSGLEDAFARLEAGQDPELPATRYLGEDWDGDGILSSREAGSEVYRPTVADTSACPVRHAMRPSFWVAWGGAPDLLTADGKERGYSGRLGGEAGDGYALKVIRRGGLYVNGGDLSSPGEHAGTYDTILKGILGTLCEAMDREYGTADGLPVSRADGENLVTLRPAGGWTSFEQIQAGALGGSRAKLDALRDDLALQAWVDRKVIRPNADPAVLGVNRPTWAGIKAAHLPVSAGSKAPGFETSGGRILGRAPVDLAWARHNRPVLIALLAGLRGRNLDETSADTDITGTHVLGTFQPAELALDWTQATDDCREVAAQILASTSELGTWQDWDAFCDVLVVSDDNSWGVTIPEQFTDLRQSKRDLLKANFNPNSDLNKFNPDRSMARRVDKSDLLAYSTEFNLVPRGGWRLEAAGRLLDAQGRVLALRTLSAETVQDSLLKLTTQGEFVAGNLGDLQTAGDESGFRVYGAAPYISASAGIGKTFGHRLFGDPGVSLQTWPEPHTVWTAPGVGTPAAYDGRLQLATTETADGEDHQVPSIPGSMRFLASWGAGFDGDYSGGGGSLSNAPPLDLRQPPATNSLWKAPLVNTLYPDGIYLEKDRQPGYAASGNMHPYHGVLSFWVKPNQDARRGTAPHMYFNNTRVNGGNHLFWVDFTACMMFGNIGAISCSTCMGSEPPDAFGMIVENEYCAWNSDGTPNTAADSQDKEHTRKTPSREVLPHRWYLLHFFWAMDQTSVDRGTQILVDRGQTPSDRNAPEHYYPSTSVQGPPIDFTWQPGGTAVFYLGHRGNATNGAPPGSSLMLYGYPDATFDEFAIYDFGNGADVAITRTETLALNRFVAGRYYKESAYAGLGAGGNQAGEWFSAPIALGPARLTRLAWTQVVPRGLRSPGVPAGRPEDGDAGPDGRVLLELVDLPGTGYALPGTFGRDAGQPLARVVGAPFRLHAVFQSNLSDPLGTAILDSLSLDDVTLVYRDPGRSQLSSWREDE